jgi:hypothetical protein
MKPNPRSRPSPPTFGKFVPHKKKIWFRTLTSIFHSCKEEKFEWVKRVDFWRREKRGKSNFFLGKRRLSYYGMEQP